MTTIQDTLAEDLVAYWSATPPDGMPAGWTFYHAKHDGPRETPCVVIGDTGCLRVPGQPDTGMVALRIMPLSALDQVTAADHRTVAGVLDAGLVALLDLADPLDRAYIHDLLREEPQTGIDEEKRQEFTELRYTAVVSRTRAVV
jgi:hypothetical protein